MFFYRSLEKETSSDFGPTAEFAYLYNQCYDLTTSEYVPVCFFGGGGVWCLALKFVFFFFQVHLQAVPIQTSNPETQNGRLRNQFRVMQKGLSQTLGLSLQLLTVFVLRTWGHWDGPEGNVYTAMKYENGLGCWQGPNRATTVSL